MCGFVYANFKDKKFVLDDVSSRGPDSEKEIINEYGYFYQSHLITNTNNSVCPIANQYGVLLYNGTEYQAQNDTDSIVSNLSDNIDKNLDFLKTLQGDFAICFVTDRYIFLATDSFVTKPLYFGFFNSKICVASTPTPIKEAGFYPFLMDINCMMVFERKTAKFVNKFTINIFNLDQTKDNLDDIFIDFEFSVLSRFKDNCLVNLSSGYDSGAIAACLTKYNKKYQVAIYVEHENKDILKKRLSLENNKKHLINKKKLTKRKQQIVDILNKNLLPKTDIICELALETANIAHTNNCRINLTGTGADELYSDYGYNGIKIFNHRSLFGGLFPQQLGIIFPWHNSQSYALYNDMRALDYCNGLYGIDSRHPFLDKKLFQTWLNSNNKIKNYSYKHWIEQYMIQCNYPFATEKIGLGSTIAINII